MYDAIDIVVGAVLGKINDRVFHTLYYVGRTFDDAQKDYTTLEKEFWHLFVLLINLGITWFCLRLFVILTTVKLSILCLSRMSNPR